MRRAVVLVSLAACSYAPLRASGGDDVAPEDAAPVDVPPIDSPIDAPIDAPAVPVTTTFPCAADLFLRTGASPNENTNDRDHVIVDGDVTATPLFRFDLSAIPTGATVMTADLVVFDTGDAGGPATFHQLLEAWDEATATSNVRMAGVAWMGAGATPPSRSASVMGDISPSIEDQAYTVPLDLATVQAWVATPATNFGLALVTTDDNGARFASRENAAAATRPTLTLTYLP